MPPPPFARNPSHCGEDCGGIESHPLRAAACSSCPTAASYDGSGEHKQALHSRSVRRTTREVQTETLASILPPPSPLQNIRDRVGPGSWCPLLPLDRQIVP